jgi:ubiquilin
MHATHASRPSPLAASGNGGSAGRGAPIGAGGVDGLLNNPLVSSMLDSPEALASLHGAILNNPEVRARVEHGAAHPSASAHLGNTPRVPRADARDARE